MSIQTNRAVTAAMKGRSVPKRAKVKRGRPPLPAEEARVQVVRVRVTAAEALVFERLGAAVWLRAALRRNRSKAVS